MFYILYFLLAIILAIFLFKNYPNVAKKNGLVDFKNQNYAFQPTPTGSGIIFLLLFLLGNIYFYFNFEAFVENLPNRYYIFILSISSLTVISFKDDIKEIDPIFRLIMQIVFIYLAITNINLNLIDLPSKFIFMAAVIIWIYIMNITNFIDGLDGFLISCFLFSCVNILIIKALLDISLFSYYIALICLPFSIVFFVFNKPKAKLFMGDAGSIFLGFLIGYFFLELLVSGHWNLSISLIFYKLVDCTYCLIKKLKKGIMPWVGMYDYFFLKPARINKNNHLNVLYIQIIFQIINSIIIFSQIYFDMKIFFILSIIFGCICMWIYKNLENNLKILKINK